MAAVCMVPLNDGEDVEAVLYHVVKITNNPAVEKSAPVTVSEFSKLSAHTQV